MRCTTCQCTPGALERMNRPYASKSISRPSTVGRLLRDVLVVGGHVDLAPFEAVPRGHVVGLALRLERVGIAAAATSSATARPCTPM